MPTYTDQILASWLQEIPSQMYNQISKSSPLMYMLMRKKKTWDQGGDTIKPHLKTARSTSNGSYRGYDTLDITPQNTRQSATFNMKQYYGNLIISGYEELGDKGKNAIFKQLAIATDDAKDDLLDKFNQDIFGTGAGNGGKNILGLQAAIDDGTVVGTYASIDRSTNPWWRSYANNTTGTLNTAKMRSAVTRASLGGGKGGMDKAPDFIVTDPATWEIYANMVDGKTTIQQPLGKVGEEFANLGFTSVSFQGIPVVYDEYCPVGTMYFINSNFLQFWVKPGRDFTPSEMVKPANMDAKVGQIFWAGELINTAPRKHAVLRGITA